MGQSKNRVADGSSGSTAASPRADADAQDVRPEHFSSAGRGGEASVTANVRFHNLTAVIYDQGSVRQGSCMARRAVAVASGARAPEGGSVAEWQLPIMRRT